MLEPISDADWSPVLAAHLLNRAGFGASPSQIDAFAAMKPAEAVEQLVDYDSQADVDPPGWTQRPDSDLRPDGPGNRKLMENLSPEERQRVIQERRQEQIDLLMYLRWWWLKKMRHTVSPLEEKLTLFWHGHFATSFTKVRSAYAMYLQNQILRRHALGHFKDLVVAVAKDPAMLFYLDNEKSRKEHPNENFARELMELFTLGEGNYTETDILEAARAFTGWTIDRERVRFLSLDQEHDNEQKTFMDLTGNLDGHDVIDKIIGHPACAPFIASKLWRYFVYEDVEAKLTEELGAAFRKGGMEIKPFLKTIFLSRSFYTRKAAFNQIKSPIQWLVGSLIMLEGRLPEADQCSFILKQLGQELFSPPNVKGWDGGYSWITTSSLTNRYNLAGFLVKGGSEMMGSKAKTRMKNKEQQKSGMTMMAGARRSMSIVKPIGDIEAILPDKQRRTNDQAWRHLEWRMYQRRLDQSHVFAVKKYLTQLSMPSKWTDDQVRTILHVMMSSPYYQVC